MEKICFIVSQIVTTMQILNLKNASFCKRVLSRMILVRINDFVNLSRQYNNLRSVIPRNKRIVRTELNAISDLYDEFLLTQRNKFSGHIQDLELIERYNLWLEIDFDTIVFFKEVVLIAYDLFQDEVGFNSNIEKVVIDLNEVRKIEEINEQFDLENEPRMASDIFALTRFNTGGFIPITSAQVRISVLSGIELFIEYEELLLSKLEDTSLKNIVRSLLLLDVTSYLDNIYTRKVPAGAPQEMDGLEEILKQEGDYPKAVSILENFRQVYNLDVAFKSFREARNKIAAHIDVSENLADLLSELEHIDYDDFLRNYSKIQNVFRAACQAEFSLQHLLFPVTKLNGVLSLSMQPNRAFDSSSIPQVTFHQNQNTINNEELYDVTLQDYIGRRISLEDTRRFFYNAFSSSEEIERISFGRTVIILRKAHMFFLSRLLRPTSQEEVLSCLEIMNSCKNGYPDQLDYILCRTYSINKSDRKSLLNYIFQFGEISCNNLAHTIDIIREEAKSIHFVYSYQALLALMKIEVRNNGIQYINGRQEAKETKEILFIFSHLDELDYFRRYVISILLLSELLFNTLLTPYQSKYQILLIDRLRVAIRSIIDNASLKLFVDIDKNELSFLFDCLDRNIFTSLLIFVADRLNESQKNIRCFLYELITSNTLKINYQCDMFLIHLGYSYVKTEKFSEAEYFFKKVIERNPEKPSTYIYLLQLYAETKDKNKYEITRKELSQYQLSGDIVTALVDLDLMIGFSN